MFPGPGAVVDYNEAGEPLGWDYPTTDEPPDPDDWREQNVLEDEVDYCDYCGEDITGETVEDKYTTQWGTFTDDLHPACAEARTEARKAAYG